MPRPPRAGGIAFIDVDLPLGLLALLPLFDLVRLFFLSFGHRSR